MTDPAPTESLPKLKPIKITSVSYGMTVSLPNYENVKFSMSAEVTEEDDWRDVLESLRRKSRKLRTRIIEEGA